MKEKKTLFGKSVKWYVGIAFYSCTLAIVTTLTWTIIYNGFAALWEEFNFASEWWWIALVWDCVVTILLFVGGCELPEVIKRFRELHQELKEQDEMAKEKDWLEKGDC